MHIQINTDRNINGHEIFITKISSEIESSLSRFSKHITRLEIHLSDENGDKSGQDDKRCVIEARLERRQPIAVTHQADTLDKAIEGAVAKLIKLIENTLDRLHDQQRIRIDPMKGPQRLDE